MARVSNGADAGHSFILNNVINRKCQRVRKIRRTHLLRTAKAGGFRAYILMMTLYTLLYDGQCRICTWQVDIIARADRAGYLTFADINTTNIHIQFPHITPYETQQALHLIGPHGLLRGADAVRHILLLLPKWRILGALLYLPGVMSLAHPVYRWVAHNRYWLGGRILCPNDTCRISDTLPETSGG